MTWVELQHCYNKISGIIKIVIHTLTDARELSGVCKKNLKEKSSCGDFKNNHTKHKTKYNYAREASELISISTST